METIRGSDPDEPATSGSDVAGNERPEMPPEPEPSPGERDRAGLGDDDVSEQAP